MTIVIQYLSARDYQSYLDNLLLSVIWYFKNYPFSNTIEISKGNSMVTQARHMEPLNLQLGSASVGLKRKSSKM